jgi:hypothetical protein
LHKEGFLKVDTEEQRKNLMAIIDAFPVNANAAQAMQIVQEIYKIRLSIEKAGIDNECCNTSTAGCNCNEGPTV